MLPGQDGGGHQDGALLSGGHALEGRPQGHLGLAEAHVPAEQPVHGGLALHVVLDLVDAPQLVLGLVKLEPGLKVPLPLPVGREGEAFLLHPLGVELDKLLGDVLHRRPHPGLLLLPLGAAQAVELHRRVLPGADVFAHHVQLGDRHVQGVVLRVPDFDVVLGDAVHLQLVDALEHADAVAAWTT